MSRRYPDVYVRGDAKAKKMAQLGLDVRAAASPSNRCCLTTQEAGAQGIGSGIARARDIIAGKRVNAMQVKGYFDRHHGYYEAAVAKAAAAGKSLEDFASQAGGKPIQGWWIWGGDSMRERAEEAVAEWRDTQEREAGRLANPWASCSELDAGLALMDPPSRIDFDRVERIAAVFRRESSWGSVPPVRGFLGVVVPSDMTDAPGSITGRLWSREPTLEDLGSPYLQLIGGGTHRVLAACSVGVPIRFRLAFSRPLRAVDDRALVRRLTQGWTR